MNDAQRQLLVYSIVVPVYNSGAWLDELALRIESVMTSLSTAWELVLVNDRSSDPATWPAIAALAERYSWVRGLDLLYNVGQFRATLCGLEHASGQYVITMDDDLQHPPEELPKLIEAMKQHPAMDCIMGKYMVKQHNAVRNAGSWLLRKIMNRLYNKPAGLVTTSFRIMPASFAKTLCLYRISTPQLGPLVISITKRVMNIPVMHHERQSGTSGYSFFHCVQETFQSVINGSILPLRWFSAVGFITAVCAFLIGAYYLLRWLFGGIGVAGFTSLILTISFFSGMLLAGVGVLGEYIGRIIGEVTGLPRYVLRVYTKPNPAE
jgi:glycosyltransferase involved in cell wall biosynthesis